MNQKFTNVISFTKTHRQIITVSGLFLIGVAVLIGLFAYNLPKSPKMVYQPLKACELLTPDKAIDLLGGGKVINTEKNTPVVTENTAVSQCSYSNTSQTDMKIVALAVMSAINDEGVQKVKSDFAERQRNRDTTPVTGIGEEAYFDNSTGQLNVLLSKQWATISYGSANDPISHTVNESLPVAHKILDKVAPQVHTS